MISVNELMINNYVEFFEENGYKEIVQVELIGNDYIQAGCVEIGADELNPISVTEEILEKCGYQFDHQVEDIKTFKKGMRYATLIKGTLYTAIMGCDCEIKSLHQFQNLYFLLTGKQLEINL